MGCAAGSEANGCKDAQLDSDHVLQCAQLRRRVLPNLKLERLFTEKGPCTIDLAAPFNKEMLSPGDPVNFNPPWRAASLVPPGRMLFMAGGAAAVLTAPGFQPSRF